MHNLPHTLQTSRIIHAPRARVWQAWENPDELIQWFGPEGFTCTFNTFEFKTGGTWDFVMHGFGHDFTNIVHFNEIVPQERIAYSHGDLGDSGFAEFNVVVTFSDHPEGTLITLTHHFASEEELKKQVEMGAKEGGESTLTKLDAFVSH